MTEGLSERLTYHLASSTTAFRRRVAAGRLARMSALPTRTAQVGRHVGQTINASSKWLVSSREHTNLTYNLTELNRTHLEWFVATVANIGVGQARVYVAELLEDDVLREHVANRTETSNRSGLADREVRYGRRLGWYALVRARKPAHVVETGTDKGLGACVLAAALLRNGYGQLTTMDINDAAGYLLTGKYASVADLRIGDSLTVLPTLPNADLFIHDSWHSREHEDAEIRGVRLQADALVISDNAHVTSILPSWAEETGRRFAYFQEQPANHWYPGGGIGAAW